MRVPVTPFLTRAPLRDSPDCGVNPAVGPSPSNTPGLPRWKDMPWIAGARSTSTSSRDDSALTTEAPTPCSPPVATYEPPPNFPPACSLVKITSTPGSPVFGSLSTGMPRPSSCTSTDLSACSVTSMRLAAPASASSTPLSMISHTQCMSPRVSVDPMYMPGRLRTASRPSRTSRWWALYVLSMVVPRDGLALGAGTCLLELGCCPESTRDTPEGRFRHAYPPDGPRGETMGWTGHSHEETTSCFKSCGLATG